MNTQPITPQTLGDGKYLRVNEIFYSIQGEGPWSGQPCVFIRLSGCNLCCTWCDTQYTRGSEKSINQILLRARTLTGDQGVKRVVITGGEPLIHNIVPLINLLWDNDIAIQIETNGTQTIPGFPWGKVVVVCSPKAGKIQEDILDNCCTFKYVVRNNGVSYVDGLPNSPTQEKGKRGPPIPPGLPNDWIWLMPQDGDTPEEQIANEKLCVDLCLTYGYRLSMRLHKILNVR